MAQRSERQHSPPRSIAGIRVLDSNLYVEVILLSFLILAPNVYSRLSVFHLEKRNFPKFQFVVAELCLVSQVVMTYE